MGDDCLSGSLNCSRPTPQLQLNVHKYCIKVSGVASANVVFSRRPPPAASSSRMVLSFHEAALPTRGGHRDPGRRQRGRFTDGAQPNPGLWPSGAEPSARRAPNQHISVWRRKCRARCAGVGGSGEGLAELRGPSPATAGFEVRLVIFRSREPTKKIVT